MAKPKIAVVLSGCGVYDGSEIHEAVLTLLALDRHGAAYDCFAPDIPQHHVIDHRSGQEMPETRNVLVESARIARGKIRSLAEFKASEFDGLIFPGGFGAAKNLSSLAFDGPNCTVNPEVARAIRDTVAARKPIGALCIAPAVMAKVIEHAEVTIGNDEGTAKAIAQMGGVHKITTHGQTVFDAKHKLVTTPCYMLDATISQIADGAEAAVKKVLELARG